MISAGVVYLVGDINAILVYAASGTRLPCAAVSLMLRQLSITPVGPVILTVSYLGLAQKLLEVLSELDGLCRRKGFQRKPRDFFHLLVASMVQERGPA